MALAVFKYDVRPGNQEVTPIEIPHGAKPLYVGPDPHTQHTMLWALVDTDRPLVEVFCAWIWTGRPVPTGVTYVGSHLADGWEMRHVFIGPTDKEGFVTTEDMIRYGSD